MRLPVLHTITAPFTAQFRNHTILHFITESPVFADALYECKASTTSYNIKFFLKIQYLFAVEIDTKTSRSSI